MRSKEEIKQLEKEVKILFLKANIKPPKRILPNIIIDGMNAKDCFKTRIRTLISEILTTKNYDINEEGIIITKIKGENPSLIKNQDKKEMIDKIKNKIKKELNIDINKF